jgi:hypothetical protein
LQEQESRYFLLRTPKAIRQQAVYSLVAHLKTQSTKLKKKLIHTYPGKPKVKFVLNYKEKQKSENQTVSVLRSARLNCPAMGNRFPCIAQLIREKTLDQQS